MTTSTTRLARLLPALCAGLLLSACLPVAGNPNGTAPIPPEAWGADATRPTQVIGSGTPQSCTSQAVVAAVARGGIITFDCGPEPHTIVMHETARVFNNSTRDIVIDGGGLVTLSGDGQRRILYMNTCDRSLVWTTPHCQDQDHPRLTIQNLTFVDGNSTGQLQEGGGGGAVFVRGGRVKIVGSRFFRNQCDPTGPDVGGGAVRVLSQHAGQPVYVVNSTFGGMEGQGNRCSNGGAISSIGVSWVILNSVLSWNEATGVGANPQRSGTPGGGNGGAVYMDGNQMTLRVAGSVLDDNRITEGGGAIFFVSNNRTGTMRLEQSSMRRNRGHRFETPGFPGIFFLGAGSPVLVDTILER